MTSYFDINVASQIKLTKFPLFVASTILCAIET